MTQKLYSSKLISSLILSSILFKPLLAIAEVFHGTSLPINNLEVATNSMPLRPAIFVDMKKHPIDNLEHHDLSPTSFPIDMANFSDLSNEELDTVRGGSRIHLAVDPSLLKNTVSLTSSTSSLATSAMKPNTTARELTPKVAAVASTILKVFSNDSVKQAGDVLGLGVYAVNMIEAFATNPSLRNQINMVPSTISMAGTAIGKAGSTLTGNGLGIVGASGSLALAAGSAYFDAAKASGKLAPAVNVMVNSTPSPQTYSSVATTAKDTLSSGVVQTARIFGFASTNTGMSSINTSPKPSPIAQPQLVPQNGSLLANGFSCAGACK